MTNWVFIYLQTYIGDILVAINPFKYLSIYEKEVRMCFFGYKEDLWAENM